MDKIPQARVAWARLWRQRARPNKRPRFAALLSRQGADVCLADYCDVLQCDAYAAAAAAAARDAPAPPQLARCSAGAMERAHHRCQARPSRARHAQPGRHSHPCHVTQMLLDTCFPRDAADARVHELNGACLPVPSWIRKQLRMFHHVLTS